MNTKYILTLISCALFFISCEEEITLEMPDNKEKVVVEGYIQPNYPIVVQLTSSKGYFDEITENELMDVFLSDVTDIKVIRNSDKEFIELEYIPLFDAVGFYSDASNFNPNFAKFGESYTLEIIYNGDTITANTNIPFIETEEEPIVDSIWFVEDELFPGYGDFYMLYNDHDTMGNNIMLESKRIFHYNLEEEKNTPDFKFVKALWGAVRNDFEGFNGVKHFETYFDRGEDAVFGDMGGRKKDGEFGNFNMRKDTIIEDSLITIYSADTVLIRLSQIDEASFNFWRGTEYQEQTNGNPFAEPINLSHNINGGFGIWEGKGAVYFKVVAEEDTAFTVRYTPKPFIPENPFLLEWL
jgi:hypothetical protein